MRVWEFLGGLAVALCVGLCRRWVNWRRREVEFELG